MMVAIRDAENAVEDRFVRMEKRRIPDAQTRLDDMVCRLYVRLSLCMSLCPSVVCSVTVVNCIASCKDVRGILLFLLLLRVSSSSFLRLSK